MDSFIVMLKNGGTYSNHRLWNHLIPLSTGTSTRPVTERLHGNLFFHHSSVPHNDMMHHSYIIAPWHDTDAPQSYTDIVNAMEDAHSGMQIEITVPQNSSPLRRFSTGKCCYSIFLDNDNIIGTRPLRAVQHMTDMPLHNHLNRILMSHNFK